MKVSELIELLESIPSNYDVVLSGDSEGNYFSPIPDETNAFSLGMYVPESEWMGEMLFNSTENEDDWEENAVVLWPTQ